MATAQQQYQPFNEDEEYVFAEGEAVFGVQGDVYEGDYNEQEAGEARVQKV